MNGSALSDSSVTRKQGNRWVGPLSLSALSGSLSYRHWLRILEILNGQVTPARAFISVDRGTTLFFCVNSIERNLCIGTLLVEYHRLILAAK